MSTQVLVVDDDPRITSLLRRALRFAGHTVRVAQDGLEGLAMVEAAAPDLVILDVMLPGLDGLGVCRRLRGMADTPILITSNVPVVVERPQYEGPSDLNKAVSGSDVFGRNGGASSWLFPGGSIGTGNQEQIYLFNPSLKPVQIRLTMYAATGTSVQRALALAVNSRSSLDLTSIGGLPAGQVGVQLQTTNGQVFIAERLELNAAHQTASSTQGIAQ